MKKYSRTLFVILLLCFFSGKAQVQHPIIDSLKKSIISAKKDSNKVKLFLALGNAFQEENNDLSSAKNSYQEAGKLSREISYPNGVIEYIFDYSDALVQQGIYDSSLYMNQEALSIAVKEKDSVRLVRALFNIGVSYSGLENYQQAISYFLQAKDYFESHKMMDKVGMCANELMILLRQTKQYRKAIKYGEEAIALYRKYRKPVKLAIPLQNLSVVYQSMQQPLKAAPILKEALAINKKYDDEYGELNDLINLTDLMFNLNEYEYAKPHIERTLFLARKIKDDESICDGQLNMSRYYLYQTKLALSKLYADSALQTAERTDINELKQECFLNLSHIAYASHNFQSALKEDEHINLTQQAITTANIDHSIIELQTKYETAKKVAQIKQLQTQQVLQELSIQRKRTYLIITLGILAVLLIVGFMYYRNYQRKQKLLKTERKLQQQRIANLEKEKQLMATEAVLKGQEEERSRLAKDLHDGLGGILSGAKYSLNNMKENMIIPAESAAAFEKTVAMLDNSISELRRIAHNMMPENLVTQTLSDALKDFCQQVSASDALQIDYHDFGMENFAPNNTIKVTVYRIVQELINNIMKHAQARNAVVQLIVKEQLLNLTVEDDGQGFDTAQLKNVEGIGYKNINSRIKFLNGKIDLRSKSDEGTSVYIEIPI